MSGLKIINLLKLSGRQTARNCANWLIDTVNENKGQNPVLNESGAKNLWYGKQN